MESVLLDVTNVGGRDILKPHLQKRKHAVSVEELEKSLAQIVVALGVLLVKQNRYLPSQWHQPYLYT